MKHKAEFNALLACLIMFLIGSQEAVSVFNNAIEQSSVKPGYLDNVWSSSIGFASLVAAFATSFAGVYLNAGQDPLPFQKLPFGASKTHRIAILSAAASLSFATFSFAGWGVTHANKSALRFAVAMQGSSVGIYYVVALELLASWMPRHSGVAVGCGHVAFGVGPIVFAWVFHNLIHSLGCSNALYAVCISLTICTALFTFLLEWPPLPSEKGYSDSADAPALSVGRKIPFSTLVRIPSFWHFMFVVSTTQVGFAFYPFFFTVGLTFDKPMNLLVHIFQLAFFFGMISRFVAGVASNNMGISYGPFRHGSKNLMMLILAIQATLFIMLISISSTSNFSAFVPVSILVFCMYGAGSCNTILLARDFFSPANSALVFGLGAGIMMCLGEFLTAGIMSIFTSWTSSDTRVPSSYNLFYLICAIWSFSGTLSCLLLKRCEQAFETPCPDAPFVKL